MRDQETFKRLVSEAEAAFWEVIAKGHPEITTGDLAPETTFAFSAACEAAALAWVGENSIGESSIPPIVACPHCGNDDLDSLAVTETFTAYHHIRNRVGPILENALAYGCPSERFDEGASDYAVNCGKCGKTSDPIQTGLGEPSTWEWE